MAVDDAYTKILLHFNGEDAAVTFTDESDKAWTAVNGVQIDTAQSKFGGASGLFDGTTDYISTPHSTDFNFGSGDFTIDFWVRPATTSIDRHTIYSQYLDASNYIQLSIVYDYLVLYVGVSGSSIATYVQFANHKILLNTWVHVAIVRSGTSILFFLNGVQETGTTTTAIGSSSMPNLAAPVIIGCRKYTGTEDRYLNGYLDEFRISKGIARWTANFVPGAPYGG